jgi:putative PIN family toxin of toxin-antitoxin system
MVFLQALLRESSPAGICFELASDQQVELVVSPVTMAELEDVLNRPELRKKFKKLTDERVNEFLEEVRIVATLIEFVPELYTLIRDPKDSCYINLAETAHAEHLVTRDKDLLDLMTNDDAESVAFRIRFPGITILDPLAFVRKLHGEEAHS